MARILLGTSGWSYPAWRGVFYPEALPQQHELAYASRAFTSLEINRSFYSLLTPACCQAWHDAVPPGFIFAIKGSRFITHLKRLREAEAPLANFFASGPLALAEKLGPVVWQLPPWMPFDEEHLAQFLAQLPRSLAEAARLAKRHDQRLKHGTYTHVAHDQELRHVLEPRHESFLTAACARLLRRHRIALAVTDSPNWRYAEEATTDFMYIRLHGSSKLYASRYSDAELDHWAERIRAWHEGREPSGARRLTRGRTPARAMDVYVYFDNDAAGHAVHDAKRLAQRLSVSESGPRKAASNRNRRPTPGATAPALHPARR